jgi:hypothetical protein
MQPEDAQPEKTGRNEDGTFAKGFSANPSGRPKGAKNKATRLAESLIDDHGELLVRQALAMGCGRRSDSDASLPRKAHCAAP